MTRLPSAAAATAYQREWFATLHERASAGEPVALVNADAPQEILRALDIPYVVNQWWASVCASRGRAAASLDELRRRGYPTDHEQYNTLSLGSTFDSGAPWGGLPPISFVLAETTGDALRKIGEVWQREHGAHFLAFERTVAPMRDPVWWERIEDDWETLVGLERIDLMTAELTAAIGRIEQATGRRFNTGQLAKVMALVNEQQLANRAARDLIARTVPAPVSIMDTIPSVMIPQWHRGTEWAVEAARRFHREVSDRVAHGVAARPDEQIRLMWIGTGLWHDLDLYQWVQERFGAVFVWSMYLAIAADGYIRRGADPLRTLAGRFAAFPDLINAPPWASEWYAKEARHNQIDGAVHFAGTDRRGVYFVDRALERTGVPVLRIGGDSADDRDFSDAEIRRSVEDFIRTRVEPLAAARRSGRGAP
jgi:benzoyl-CoA reductase/2-hydroxyglutaryl-CoA dehydratase subunit BcrC/BadD/HgdB